MPTAEPEFYLLNFRPNGGARWRKVGRFASFAEAVAAINAGGDWHLASVYPLTAERTAQLADEFAAATGQTRHDATASDDLRGAFA